MKTNYANTYLLENKISVYATIEPFPQIIFYWDIQTNKQCSQAIWRNNREPFLDAEIVHYDFQGCRVKIYNRIYDFTWSNTNNAGTPYQTGQLTYTDTVFEDDELEMSLEQIDAQINEALAWYQKIRRY